jgi:phosphatidylglycerol---prolipoprotein diacylglyceryl transferase
MKPFFNLYNIVFNSYQSFLIISVIAFVIVLKVLVYREKLKNLDFWTYISVIFVIGFIGAKMFYMMEDFPNSFSFNHFFNLRKGYVLYGGVFFVFLTTFLYSKFSNINPFILLDINVIAMSLSLFVGKIACLMAGCCYGIPTNLNYIGLVYTSDYCIAFPKNEPLFPIQIVDSLFGLLLFVFLWYFKGKLRVGYLFFIFMIVYPIYRFCSEFFRGDESRGFVFDGLFSLSQFYSLILVIFIITLILVFRKKNI